MSLVSPTITLSNAPGLFASAVFCGSNVGPREPLSKTYPTISSINTHLSGVGLFPRGHDVPLSYVAFAIVRSIVAPRIPLCDAPSLVILEESGAIFPLHCIVRGIIHEVISQISFGEMTFVLHLKPQGNDFAFFRYLTSIYYAGDSRQNGEYFDPSLIDLFDNAFSQQLYWDYTNWIVSSTFNVYESGGAVYKISPSYVTSYNLHIPIRSVHTGLSMVCCKEITKRFFYVAPSVLDKSKQESILSDKTVSQPGIMPLGGMKYKTWSKFATSGANVPLSTWIILPYVKQTDDNSVSDLAEITESLTSDIPPELVLDVGKPHERDVRLVVDETGVTRERAIRALNEHDGNIVDAVLALAQPSPWKVAEISQGYDEIYAQSDYPDDDVQ